MTLPYGTVKHQMNVREKILELIERHRTQQVLADRLGLDQSTISKYKKGDRPNVGKFECLLFAGITEGEERRFFLELSEIKEAQCPLIASAIGAVMPAASDSTNPSKEPLRTERYAGVQSQHSSLRAEELDAAITALEASGRTAALDTLTAFAAFLVTQDEPSRVAPEQDKSEGNLDQGDVDRAKASARALTVRHLGSQAVVPDAPEPPKKAGGERKEGGKR